MTTMSLGGAVCIVLAGAGACGGGEGGASDAGITLAAGPLLPLRQGSEWAYVTAGGTETWRVEAREDVGGAKAGTQAFRVRQRRPGQGDTLVYLEDVDGRVVRHLVRQLDPSTGEPTREESYEPYLLVVDGTAEGRTIGTTVEVSFVETVVELGSGQPPSSTPRMASFTALAIEDVVVPAGRFQALRVAIDDERGTSTRWFTPNIGLVASSAESELTSFFIP